MQMSFNSVDEAIHSRRSIRRFKSDEVPLDAIHQILSIAARAPSGSNSQPWGVYVLSGAPKEALSEALVKAHFECNSDHTEEYQYDAKVPFEPFLTRKREFGRRLYGRLNIEYSENPLRLKQVARNYMFFDAPIGIIVTLHKDLGLGSWIDLGMFLQNIMISARGRDLDTCAQVSFAKYHRLIKPMLRIPEHEIVVCGMALGKADDEAPENAGFMPRSEVSQFAKFIGF